MPSFILIRPTVWPQYTNITDRTDRQRIDSIGRTVLQTVAQKVRSLGHFNGKIGSKFILFSPDMWSYCIASGQADAHVWKTYTGVF